MDYIFAFLAILTPVVFIHEMGHYWVARKSGVVVEVFSIGFGPELFARVDKQGTRSVSYTHLTLPTISDV